MLNVPMKFLERHLFGKAKERANKTAERFARPISLVLAILFVVVLVLVVVLVVAPELGTTFISVGKRIEENIPKLQIWAEHTFREDSLLWSGPIPSISSPRKCWILPLEC